MKQQDEFLYMQFLPYNLNLKAFEVFSSSKWAIELLVGGWAGEQAGGWLEKSYRTHICNFLGTFKNMRRTF